MARALADKIDGGLACSRPLTEGVDWMPQSTYVGVSGLTLTPKVYVACGISRIQVKEIIKPVVPYIVASTIALLLVTYIPQISLALPTVLGQL